MSDDRSKGEEQSAPADSSAGSGVEFVGAVTSFDTLPTENKSEFTKFRANYVIELAPEGEQELDLVLQIIRLSWRLKNFCIFFAAQAALKQFAPLIHETLELTRAAHIRFESKFMQALHDEVIPRHKLVRKQAEESLRETCKTIEDPSLREEVENIIKHFNTGQSLSDQEVAELLLQSGLSPEARKIRQSEKAVQKENGSPLDLAYLAHAITVQSCMTELELREAIERALDRALARYWKLKEEKRKAKEARARMSRLLPPYRDGKPPSFIRWRTLTL